MFLQIEKFNYYDHYSGVAQLVEQATVNRWVTGSSPVAGAIIIINVYKLSQGLWLKSVSFVLFLINPNI